MVSAKAAINAFALSGVEAFLLDDALHATCSARVMSLIICSLFFDKQIAHVTVDGSSALEVRIHLKRLLQGVVSLDGVVEAVEADGTQIVGERLVLG